MIYNLRNKLSSSNNRFINRIVFYIRDLLYFLRYKFAKSFDEEFLYLEGKRKCIVCLAADYGNLGDVAITYAQTRFLSEKFPDYEIVDFPISKTLTHLKSLKKVCTSDDIITVTGGGYMGDLYFRSELLRQLIFKVFRKNRIISFPQTADFSDSFLGKQLLKQAQYIYSKCDNLELWAREKRSYHFMKEYFPQNNIYLTPDIVMSLDEFKNNLNRKGVTFCLRDDKEKNEDTDFLIGEIKEFLNNSGEIIEYYDTHIGNVHLDIQQRVIELNKIWNQFRKSELVVTDRLHGMIFAYITGTPAVVLRNNNLKIIESFEWLNECGYIHLVLNEDDLFKFIQYKNQFTEEGFKRSQKIIKDIFKSLLLSN